MDPDQLAGILIVMGAVVGLVSTTITLWTIFSVMGWFAFALVLVFGVYVFRQRSEARLLAIATLWVAPLEAVSNARVLTVARFPRSDGAGASAFGAPFGNVLAVVRGT